jgi:hypothetical protein
MSYTDSAPVNCLRSIFYFSAIGVLDTIILAGNACNGSKTSLLRLLNRLRAFDD